MNILCVCVYVGGEWEQSTAEDDVWILFCFFLSPSPTFNFPSLSLLLPLLLAFIRAPRLLSPNPLHQQVV